MIPWFIAVLVICTGADATGQQQPDFPLETGHDVLPDSHELNLLDAESTYYVPDLSPGFLPPLSPSNTDKDLDSENLNLLEIQKRISRLVVDPHSKRWSEMFRVSPKAFQEMRNNGKRIRPFFRKDFIDGGFKMSYAPARKRPYYYTEPEGSEFLGGPGK